MKPFTRRNLPFVLIVAVLLALASWRGSYAFERLALELRYFWWLVLILVGGLWLLAKLGPKRK